ncbi:hypothetical protein HDF10_000699 [Edaphobacter lichenicola]|uniref:Uncharacterized protein n=1 Tax=Tunturiibacter lichenicola TaxID=2051959 RepID=A0A7W8J7I1_9BACT|nr:hypothetical protein [Edaphobacter lichenicola]
MPAPPKSPREPNPPRKRSRRTIICPLPLLVLLRTRTTSVISTEAAHSPIVSRAADCGYSSQLQRTDTCCSIRQDPRISSSSLLFQLPAQLHVPLQLQLSSPFHNTTHDTVILSRSDSRHFVSHAVEGSPYFVFAFAFTTFDFAVSNRSKKSPASTSKITAKSRVKPQTHQNPRHSREFTLRISYAQSFRFELMSRKMPRESGALLL